MATLTDEERAAAILGDVEPEKADEPTKEPDTTAESPEEPDEVEEESEKEKPTEDESKPDSSFTKQFPNLKGETREEYLPELEKAYDNSFKESLRMAKEIKDNAALVEQAKQIIAQGQVATPPAPADPAAPTAPLSPTLAIDDHPAIRYAKAKQTEDMLSAFDDFKKSYPQATDQQSFEQFTKASDGVNAALTSALGREPTYKELFPAIAGSLGWQVASDRSALVKENASSGRSPGQQSPAAQRPSKVSDAQVDAYLKMFTSKTREEARKELSEVL